MKRAPLLASLATVGAVVLLGGCAGARVPPPEMALDVDSRCPLPLAWPSAAQTPQRIRLENPNDVPLVVVIEGCFRLTRLAEVPPHAALQPALPPRMIAFREGIRFHAFVEDSARFVGSWHVPPRPGPSLDLVLDTLEVTKGELSLFDPVEVEASRTESDYAPRRIEDSGGQVYVMVPGVGDGGFLVFSCGGGRRWVSVSTSTTIRFDTADVAVGYDGGDPEPARWEVLHSMSDAVLAPARGVDSLAVRMARAERVNVQVALRPGRGDLRPTPTTFAFLTGGLAGELSDVPCFRGLMARLAPR